MSYLRIAWSILVFAGLAGSMVASLYYMFRAAANRTSDADSATELAVSPLRAIGYPQYLTPRGKMYRRRCVIAGAIIVILVILAKIYQPIELHI